ncbi:putative ankyrin repeat protein, partial [Diplonema papillatum]
MQQGRDATEEDEDCQPLNSGITPLQCAAAKKNLAVAQYLLSEGADVEQASPEGWTALHYAAAAGHACVIHLLKQHGAVLSAARRVDGLTPLSMAAAGGHADVVYLLLESGASPEELDFAQRCTNLLARAVVHRHITVGKPLTNNECCRASKYSAYPSWSMEQRFQCTATGRSIFSLPTLSG